jgi:hypothetical protein
VARGVSAIFESVFATKLHYDPSDAISTIGVRDLMGCSDVATPAMNRVGADKNVDISWA